MPRWFVDLRCAGRIRVNCLVQATIYLREDGRLFHLQKAYEPVDPINEAFRDPREREKFITNIFKGVAASSGCDIWECCEYVPDTDCGDLKNLWKVAAAARRTGRFLYAAKRKILKSFLEEQDSKLNWIYALKFDQSTEEYEARYRAKVERIANENKTREKESKTRGRTFHFNFNSRQFLDSKAQVDHYLVLGLSEASGPREVKLAYWAKAKECHPDLNPGSKDAEERFKKLSASYSELMKAFDTL